MKIIYIILSVSLGTLSTFSIHAMDKGPKQDSQPEAPAMAEGSRSDRPDINRETIQSAESLLIEPIKRPDAAPPDKSQSESKEVTIRSALRKYINLKSFFCELAGILSEDSYTPKSFLGLLKYIEIDQLPKLFGAKDTDLVPYFSKEKIKKLIDLLNQEDLIEISPYRKAQAFKNCFNKEAWQELLECPQADVVLFCIIDLYYLHETLPAEKLLEYESILKNLATDNRYKTLIQYFNIPDLLSIIQDTREKKPIIRERIIRTIVCDSSLVLFGIKEECERLALTDRLLAVMIVALEAKKDPSLNAILSCIKWDTAIEAAPELFGYEAKDLENFFDIEHLKKLIKKLQSKQRVTKTDVMETLSTNFYERLFNFFPYQPGLATQILNAFVDFDALARFLNGYFVDDNKKDRKNLFQFMHTFFQQIERSLGINIPNAFDTWIPEGMQISAFMSIAERLGDTRVQYSLPPLTLPLPIFFALKTKRANTVLAKTYYLSLTLAMLWVVYKFARFMYSSPLSREGLLINSTLSLLCCKGMRMLSRAHPTTSKDVITRAGHMYSQHPYIPLFNEFVKRLSQEQFKCLAHPYDVSKLLQALPDPFTFIDENHHFIESLCLGEPNQAEERIQFMVAFLEQLAKAKDLVIHEIFKKFAPALTEEDKKTLAAQSLLMLAQYRPGILYTQHNFITSIGQRTTLDAKYTLLHLLSVMSRIAKKDPKMLKSA